MVDWSNLTPEDLHLSNKQLESKNVRNFIILVALKLQNFISEQEENQAVLKDITAKYKNTSEKVLEYDLKFAMYTDKQNHLAQ